MKFRKVTARKYIGENGFTLIECKDGSFSVCKDSKVTDWGSYFTSVKAAEEFMNSHNYIQAKANAMPLNDSDVFFIFDLYGKNRIERNNQDPIFDRWSVNDTYSIEGDWIEDSEGLEDEGITDGSNALAINLYEDDEPIEQYYSAEPIIKRLDEILRNDIFSSVTLRGSSLRSILASAAPYRNAKEATRNLIRVKSSNVWAYGVEIKDNKASVGDVYVQFKGKNGGPGDIYRYYDVPVTTWRKFLSAPSKGHFLYKYLRNSYLYSKLTGNKRGVLPNAVNH